MCAYMYMRVFCLFSLICPGELARTNGGAVAVAAAFVFVAVVGVEVFDLLVGVCTG